MSGVSACKPLRVAQIIGKMVSGGVESIIFNYYRHLDHEKIQFDFYYDADSVLEPPQDIIDMGARFYQVPPYQKLPQHMAALIRHFKENNYRVVHANMNTLSIFSLCAAWIAGVPVRVSHNHSTAGRGETGKNVIKYALRPFAKLFATDYCACSRYAGRWLFGKQAMEQGRVSVFNNAIDLERFCFDPIKRAEARQQLGVDEKLVVGHVGRVCFQKNQDFLIDIFAEIHKRDPDSVLLLTGSGDPMETIQEKAHRLGLDEAVRFLGVREAVDRLYQAMDVFLLPSRYEGLPVVGVEAQASGLPCILSDAVTKEAKLCDGLRFLPLSASAAEWAEAAFDMVSACDRADTREAICAAGFDISQEAKKMEQFYLERLSASGQGTS